MKIIIYGLYELGLLYIKENKGLDILAFADDSPKVNSFRGYPVINIDQIKSHNYDKVVIAVQKWTDHKMEGYLDEIAKIIEKLKSVGIPYDKLITSRPYFISIDLGINTFAEHIITRNYILRELGITLRKNNVPGSVAECGVGRGFFASVINEVFFDKTMYLFDTFKSFNENDLVHESKDVIKRVKECKTMYGDNSLVGADVAISHCPHKDRCIKKVGNIPETFKELEKESFAFVNIDVDLYAPTLAALRFFTPRLSKGGVIWVHDYNGPWHGVKKAVEEFALECEFTLLPVGDKLSVALIPKYSKPKVSIIIPSLNAACYIRECLESVINQTLKEIEIVCVDAGSNDGTLEILHEYTLLDNRIKLIISKKKSYGFQMNLGLDAATGKYMGIVEADDFVTYDMFKILYNKAEKNNVDFVKADFFEFTTPKNCSVRKIYKKIAVQDMFYNRVYKPGNHPEAIKFIPYTWSGIYNIDFLRHFKIRHNETPGASYQDIGFWFQTFCHAKRIYLLDKPLYMYRCDNPDSSIKSWEKVDEIVKEYAFVLDFLNKDNHLNKSYMPVYYYKKYRSYIFAYNRIADKFKTNFSKVFHEEFKNDYEKGILDTSLFTKAERETLMQIINDPSIYYKSSTTLVSVIIPVYNEIQYISKCLDSVLSQTLNDIEVICVDDGSTDDSLAILGEYEMKDSRILIIRQVNCGAGIARNNAINNAAGEYISFMDADDWYPESDILEALYAKAKQNNVNICGGSFSEFYDGILKTEYKGIWSKYTFQNEGIISYRDYQFDYGFHRFIYKRDFLIDNQLHFSNYRRFQDPPFFTSAMICADIFYAVSKVTYCRRAGYKEIQWDLLAITGVLNGIIDNLELSITHQLPDLHKFTVERLRRFISQEAFIGHSAFGNPELSALLARADELASHPLRKKKRSLASIFRRGYRCYKNQGFICTIKLTMKKWRFLWK